MGRTEHFGDVQRDIYLAGLSGETPDLPVGVGDLEELAAERMSEQAWGYVAGAASSGETARENLAAFERWRLTPRMLRDISQRDLTVTVAGTELPSPVMLAPIGVLSIVHEEAELAVARAAAEAHVGMCLSTASSSTLEDVADELGDTPRWFQLYWPADPELADSLLDRAEAAGYTAVVVTLDTPTIGWRPTDLDTAYLPFLEGEGLANYFTDPVFRAGLDQPPEQDPGTAILRWVDVFSDPGHTWRDLADLVGRTDLPVLVKGVLTPADARRAVDAGCGGVIVSNHGGRQVDGAVASLEALPPVVDEVGGEADVLMDSGVRTGSDAAKALALGARAVLLGRPYTWGLGVAGQAGVEHVLRSFLADLDLAVGLSGHASTGELGRDSLVRRGRGG